MITFEEAKHTKERPELAGISAANLDAQDMVNPILQRSEIIRDQDNHHRFVKAWTKGNDGPLLGLVEEIWADELVRRAAASARGLNIA